MVLRSNPFPVSGLSVTYPLLEGLSTQEKLGQECTSGVYPTISCSNPGFPVHIPVDQNARTGCIWMYLMLVNYSQSLLSQYGHM